MVAESSLFWLPRSGNAPEEYEDASAADAAAGRFALADGASDTSFADFWARLLVEQFVAQAPLDLADWTDALPALQQRWRTAVDGLTMPYYAKAKFDRGAFATFLGVVLGEVAEGGVEWRAVAVGDTCLFHSRGNQLLLRLPARRVREVQRSSAAGRFAGLAQARSRKAQRVRPRSGPHRRPPLAGHRCPGPLVPGRI